MSTTAIEQHRRSSDIARRNRERAEGKRARRHTIDDIKFSDGPYVVCSCAWRADGPDTEANWKAHKYDVGEGSGHK